LRHGPKGKNFDAKTGKELEGEFVEDNYQEV
jgi:hypothetical protein